MLPFFCILKFLKMKAAIIGYGRMGHEIESILMEKSHEVVARIDMNNQHDWKLLSNENCDVAIEFTQPETAVSNFYKCFEKGIPVVSGTTAWLGQWDQVIEKCKKEKTAFLYASNFSLGVNIFFEINKKLGSLMQGHSQYKLILNEIHHTKKLDAPSGTAISIANGIIESNADYDNWTLDNDEQGKVPIYAKRTGHVPGTHYVTYDSPVDQILIRHEAKSREGFAQGAVLAAEFLVGKKGVFSMQDLLGLK